MFTRIELLLRKSESCFHPGSSDVVVQLDSHIISGKSTACTCQVDGLYRVFRSGSTECRTCCKFSLFQLHGSLTARLHLARRKEEGKTDVEAGVVRHGSQYTNTLV